MPLRPDHASALWHDVTPITFDTMIAEWLRDPINGNFGLKRLAHAELRKQMTPIEALIRQRRRTRSRWIRSGSITPLLMPPPTPR